MTSPPPYNVISKEEKSLRRDINKGIDRALDKEIGGQRRDITKTEREKITYFITTDLDYEITYSWYLAGVCGFMNQPTDDLDPNQCSRPSPRSYGDLQADHRKERVEEITNYVVDTVFFSDYNLKKIWYTETNDFLSDFYGECAPNKYKGIYLASLSVKDHLREICEFISKTHNACHRWLDGSILEESKEREFRKSVSRLHIELTKVDRLSETRSAVIEGTDLIEQVCFKLTNLTSLSKEQSEFIENLEDFFYNYVWKYPALKVSADTATGPNAQRLKSHQSNSFENFDQKLKKKLDEKREKAIELDLMPESNEIKSKELQNKIYIR